MPFGVVFVVETLLMLWDRGEWGGMGGLCRMELLDADLTGVSSHLFNE